MSINRKKRRFLQWERRTAKWNDLCLMNHRRYFPGHCRVHDDLMYQKRWVPIGVRAIWYLAYVRMAWYKA